MLRFTGSTPWHPPAGLAFWLTGTLLLLSLLLSGCQQTSPLPPAEPAPNLVQIVEPADLEGLRTLFKSQHYSWETLGDGVPPLIVTRFPDDHGEHLPPDEKKTMFLLSLLPMVLMANQAIEAERLEIEQLLARYDQGQGLQEGEGEGLQSLIDYYKLPGDPLTDHRARAMLLHRVDILPPSLVLAQAATESGWGTSRFAREGNNLFGQLTFVPGNGIVPTNRRKGEIHEFKRFGSLFESVRSYMRNLNTHPAYREFRDLRAQLRRSGRPLSGIQLADGLDAYSTRNSAYIADLRAVIRTSNLARTNQTFLRAMHPAAAPTFLPNVAELLVSRANAAEIPTR